MQNGYAATKQLVAMPLPTAKFLLLLGADFDVDRDPNTNKEVKARPARRPYWEGVKGIE